VWRFRELMPFAPLEDLVTIGEGQTVLQQADALASHVGVKPGCLFLQYEGFNPSGSFKDNGMAAAFTTARRLGKRRIACASTGNTSASAAAFGAYCDLPTYVLIPKGEVAMGKLAQAMIYGAKVIMVNGNFDVALDLVREFTERNEVTLVNSLNPNRIEGQKTAAFEVVDTLGDAPDLLFIPVGNAGNITAYWKGFREYQDLGRSQTLPRMMGFQAEGAAPIVRGEPVANPQTIASAIRIGNPASWQSAIEARDGSGGVIDSVSDDEILEAYRLLANKEGIFCEPASAASFAGLMKMHRQGLDLHDKRIVCICTGNGLKDPDLAVSSSNVQPIEVPPTIEAVEAATLGNNE